MHAAAERAAADVEQVVLRLKSLLLQEFELTGAVDVPLLDVADRAPVPLGIEASSARARAS